jgi:hypothetical protein
MSYFRQNQEEMRRVIDTEVDVSVEKDGDILTGKVDLLMGADGKIEVLDFKTSERPMDSPELLAAYDAGQMNLYVNYAREHLTQPGENPPIGLILCAEQSHAVAHYALGGLSTRVFASRYKLVLPNPEVLQREIEAERSTQRRNGSSDAGADHRCGWRSSATP